MFSFEMSAEQHELKNLAKKFAAEEIIPVAPQFDAEEKFPEAICRQAWELGLMNLEVPKELGGAGLGVLDTSLILEELNYGCAGITNALTANGLAAVHAHCRDRRAAEALPRSVGHEFSFAALLHHRAGRRLDVARIVDDVRTCGDEYVLNGVKHLISNGTVAQLVRGVCHPRHGASRRGYLLLRVPGRFARHRRTA